jgi:hypothetical protein
MAVLIGMTLGHQAGKFVKELGQIMGVQVLIEAPIKVKASVQCNILSVRLRVSYCLYAAKVM